MEEQVKYTNLLKGTGFTNENDPSFWNKELYKTCMYTSLDEVGATESSAVDDIFSAMATPSRLVVEVENGGENYPQTNGTLTIEKTHDDTGSANFLQNKGQFYTGVFAQGSFSGWEGISGGGQEDVIAAIKEDTTNILTILRESRPKRYGFRVDVNEGNPSSRVTYIYDAVGMKPAKMDFTKGLFDYGDWANIWFVRDNYPCMVSATGEEDYKLDPNDYTKKAGSTTESEVTSATYDGNAMAAIPLVWVARWQEGNYQYVSFCESQYDESYHAYAHTDANGNVHKVVYHALFEGSLDTNSKVRSIAGDAVYPYNLANATTELTNIQKNGANWTMRTWMFEELINDLLILIGKSTNTQAVFGQGHTSGYVNEPANHYGQLACGTLKDKGQFFGYSDTDKAVKVFHMENWWGDRWDRLQGLLYEKGVFKVKTHGTYNFTGEGYTAIGKGIQAANGGGWQKETEQTEFGNFPIAPLNASDATFECDFCWWNNDVVSVPLAGGSCDNGSRCGARYRDFNLAASRANWYIGPSPFIIPS